MPAPTTLQALGMGARAARGRAWLVAPGLLVAFARWALSWAAPAAAAALAASGFAARLAQGAASPPALLAGAVQAVVAPRSIAILAGLWLSSLLLGAALRLAFVAGALPVLGDALAGVPDRPRFTEGMAFGFAPLLPTALLGVVLEAAAQLFSWTVYLGAAILAVRHGAGIAVANALLGAAALTSAVAAPVAASLVADAALARNALAGDPPALAFAEGARRVLLRPGAFLLGAIAIGVAAAVLLGTAQAVETAALGVARGAPAIVALGPRLMVTALAAAVACVLDLWRLGTVAALACADGGAFARSRERP